MAKQQTITLHRPKGCCGHSRDQDCLCWCHDPSQGGNNVLVKDYDLSPEVREACNWVASGKPWPGRVVWLDEEPAR